MTAILVVARLTLRESLRRRLLIALAVITVLTAAGSLWGFGKLWEIPVGRGSDTTREVLVRTAASQLLIVVAFMFTAIMGLSATVVASPSISGDLESGLALSMLARPVRRADLLVGKWLAFSVLVVVYTTASALLEMLAVWIATGYYPPHPVELCLFVSWVGVALVTTSVLLSTRLGGITGGVIALVTFFASWIGGIVGSVGAALQNPALQQAGTLSHLVLPADGLWRGAIWSMEPVVFIATTRAAGVGASSNPFFAGDPPTLAYIGWCVAWTAGMLALAVWSFRAREL